MNIDSTFDRIVFNLLVIRFTSKNLDKVRMKRDKKDRKTNTKQRKSIDTKKIFNTFTHGNILVFPPTCARTDNTRLLEDNRNANSVSGGL